MRYVSLVVEIRENDEYPVNVYRVCREGDDNKLNIEPDVFIEQNKEILCQGLLACVMVGHKENYKDGAESMKEIFKILSDGFVDIKADGKLIHPNKKEG